MGRTPRGPDGEVRRAAGPPPPPVGVVALRRRAAPLRHQLRGLRDACEARSIEKQADLYDQYETEPLLFLASIGELRDDEWRRSRPGPMRLDRESGRAMSRSARVAWTEPIAGGSGCLRPFAGQQRAARDHHAAGTSADILGPEPLSQGCRGCPRHSRARPPPLSTFASRH